MFQDVFLCVQTFQVNEYARIEYLKLLKLICLLFCNTPIPLDGVSATIRDFGQNDTKRGRNAKSAAETPRAQ